MTTEQFKDHIRDGAYAWPGGYPKYFVTSDCGALSFNSAKDNAKEIIHSIRNKVEDGWRVIGVDINWEDSELYCAHSGERIDSAYSE